MGSRKTTRKPAEPPLIELGPTEPGFPLGAGSAVQSLRLRGDPLVLDRYRIGLFCSVRCPGAAILRALEWVKHVPSGADDGSAIVGGFHSPIEQECLLALIRRHVPVIVCPAREIGRYRWPDALDEAMREGRLLLLSAFTAERRPTVGTAERRNRLVLELADELMVIHADPGGKIEGYVADCAMVGKKVSRL